MIKGSCVTKRSAQHPLRSPSQKEVSGGCSGAESVRLAVLHVCVRHAVCVPLHWHLSADRV